MYKDTTIKENLSTPGSLNVASTDENLSVDGMFQQTTISSLGKQIFSVIPMHGPTAAIFNIKTVNSVPAVPGTPGTAQVDTLTLLPSAAIGTTYSVTIEQQLVTYNTLVPNETLAVVSASLVTAINNNVHVNTVTASLAANGVDVILTAKTPGIPFLTAIPLNSNVGSIVATTTNVAEITYTPPVRNAQVVRSEATVKNSKSFPTGLTQEMVQDLRNMYGKDVNQLVGKLLRGVANDDENAYTLAFLSLSSVATPSLTRTAPNMAETNIFEISQRVQELVLQMNLQYTRTYDAFCVLPFKIAASFMALSSYAGAEDDQERALFLTKIGQTKYYVNPDVTATEAYVGLKDLHNPSKSSAVFSPYMSNIVNATNSDTGEETYHIFNRYAITPSPLHETGNEMLFKFVIV